MSERTSVDNVVKFLERNRRLSLGLSVPVIRQDIPLGYRINPDNNDELIIDETKFEFLKKARKYLRESPYREVSEWLTKNDLPISNSGLNKLMNFRPPYTDDERQLYFNRTSS